MKAEKKLTIEAARIIATVSRLTEIPIKEIRGKSRKRDVVNARRICMVLINDGLEYSLTENAAMFKRDHATCLFAFKSHVDLYEIDKEYRRFFDVCAAAAGISGMSSANDKDEIIEKFVARIQHLEAENKGLKGQLQQIKELTI